jgi:nifR3 family TIM-barrel protein
MLNLKEELNKNPFVLAPMAGITDSPFRSFMREMGCGPVISELVSADGIAHNSGRTIKLMSYQEPERPVAIQLFGETPETVAKAAQYVEKTGVDWVDLNFGCPVPKVVNKGAGSAILKDLSALGKMVGTVKRAIQIPLTIKIRTGWDESNRNAHEIVEVAAKVGIAWVAIHGRTRSQGYAGSADWEFIKQIAHVSSIPIIGNGDILTADEAHEKLSGEYSHGVMIGRGALKNPWIFRECLGQSVEEKDFLKLIERHFALAIENKGSQRAYLSLKKFMGWYAAGFPYASTFRSQIFKTKDIDELWKICADFFSALKNSDRVIERQGFLMGGHG